jgi:hypothetical protein
MELRHTDEALEASKSQRNGRGRWGLAESRYRVVIGGGRRIQRERHDAELPSFLDQKSQDYPFFQGMCAGTVDAIAFMGKLMYHSLIALPLPENDFRRLKMCMDAPNGVTIGQEVKVVVAYIDARPARLHEPFEQLALQALLTAWPCK